MILVDTNVWIDHLKETDPTLTVILDEIRQRVHPFVIGELSLGNLRDRSSIIALLEEMPQAEVALHEEVMGLIADHGLHGLGIGYVDAHLLASAKLTPGTRIWTRDRRLAALCDRFGLSFQPLH